MACGTRESHDGPAVGLIAAWAARAGPPFALHALPRREIPRHSCMTSRLTSRALLLGAGLALGSAGGVQAQLPAGEPARFLQRYIGLSAAQIDQAQRGSVVTKVLETKEQDEVALFGIVAIDIPRSEVVQRVRDLGSFLKTPGRAAFGVFGTPATVGDAGAFVADQSDVDALKDCRPGDCNVKMPARSIEEFRSTIDWSSPAASAQATALVRQRMVDYVEAYRRGGVAVMVEYGDQKTAGRSGEAFASLLAESPYLYDYVPAFKEYLTKYPVASLPEVTNAIYWSMDRMPRLRPILGLTHLTIYEPPGAPLTLVSANQLYASHYFLGAFTLTTILDRTDSDGGRGVYYMVVQRMRFDHLPSGGLLNIRGRVIGKMHDALRADLEQRKSGFDRR
jgi:hypothetical protein